MSEKVKIHTQYKLKDGTSVPGVTTVIGILAKPALIYWSWDLGRQGLDYRKYRDDKADIGSLAHHLILCHLKKETPDTSEYSPKQLDQAENCLLSYFEWEKTHPIEPILVEQPLVSERYGFGGTLDLLATLNGNLCILDYKTGKGIYDEYLYQLAGYKLLVEEQGYSIKQARILKIGRDENEIFEEKIVGNLNNEEKIFLHCLEIYKLRRKK